LGSALIGPASNNRISEIVSADDALSNWTHHFGRLTFLSPGHGNAAFQKKLWLKKASKVTQTTTAVPTMSEVSGPATMCLPPLLIAARCEDPRSVS
jgi:hypothetical protein